MEGTFKAARRSVEALWEEGALRISLMLKVDIRDDKETNMAYKMASLGPEMGLSGNNYSGLGAYPTMVDRPLLVTAAVMIKEGRVLLDRRRSDSRYEPLKWEFPGGKVDFGESPQVSLKRELAEELGILAEVGALVHMVSHVYTRDGNKRHVVVLFFECGILEGEPRPLEGGEVEWFDRNAFSGLKLVEADVPLRKLVLPRLS